MQAWTGKEAAEIRGFQQPLSLSTLACLLFHSGNCKAAVAACKDGNRQDNDNTLVILSILSLAKSHIWEKSHEIHTPRCVDRGRIHIFSGGPWRHGAHYGLRPELPRLASLLWSGLRGGRLPHLSRAVSSLRGRHRECAGGHTGRQCL